ncbi:hypothetical protein [Isoptericola variabilis]|uniref:Uncharacterized protein n=1 Tax=Isoptericola variabilis (strain 225) TaxID=743718 RepID=F6FSZ5_ISOV2|nr:hypothetical protein [Isoptericola variabilis]AEG43136.1 hypothetical protein Isova_0337 [Isoptericola variabilis 225]TWH35067.1 hypothetical protein L600_000100000710 [Isoptericola variabilis J7]
MKRVLVAGTVVALGDGTLLGTALALGWRTTAIVALAVGVVGAVLVAMLTPPPRAVAQPGTVTLGLPVREPEPVTDERPAATSQGEDVPASPVGSTPSPVAA